MAFLLSQQTQIAVAEAPVSRDSRFRFAPARSITHMRIQSQDTQCRRPAEVSFVIRAHKTMFHMIEAHLE